MSDTITIRLGVEGFRVTWWEETEPEEAEAEVGEAGEPRLGLLEVGVEGVEAWSVCPWCGAGCRRVRAWWTLRVRDIPTRRNRTVLVWRRRRFGCDGCGRTHIETDPQVTGKFTTEYAGELARNTARLSIAAVSKAAKVGWSTIQRPVNAQGEGEQRRRRALPCRALQVDETSIGRGHKHYDGCSTTGRKDTPWGCSPGGAKPSLTRFFRDQGPAWRQGVEVVVTDGSTPYKAAIEQYLPKAQHVLDRFHVIRWFGQSLVQLRRDLQRRPHGDRPPAWEQSLHRSRCLLLKRGDRLNEAEQEKLQSLFDRYPQMETGWQALQELHQVYQAPNPEEALVALDRFTALYQTGQIPQYRKTVKTILRWPDQTLNYHTTGQSRQRQNRSRQQPTPKTTTHRPRPRQPPKLRQPSPPANLTMNTDQNPTPTENGEEP